MFPYYIWGTFPEDATNPAMMNALLSRDTGIDLPREVKETLELRRTKKYSRDDGIRFD